MALNPNQARQAGGKFGYGKSGAAKPTYQKASQIPAQSISPQTMAQALVLIRQQQAAARQQAATVKAETPAQKLYLAQLKAAQGILFKQQQAQTAATRKTTAEQKKTAAAAKRKAGIAAAAKARNPAAAAKGAAAGRQSRQGTLPTAPKAGSAHSSGAGLQARLQQYLAGR